MTNFQVLLTVGILLLTMIAIAIYNITKTRYYLVSFIYKIKRESGKIDEGHSMTGVLGSIIEGFPTESGMKKAAINWLKAEKEQETIIELTNIIKVDKLEYNYFMFNLATNKLPKIKSPKPKKHKTLLKAEKNLTNQQQINYQKSNKDKQQNNTTVPVLAGASTKPQQSTNNNKKPNNK